ncbi:RHS repeat-associated core domain-containing protein [Pseudomonas schmalbachii]|uniref:RHS domain-containing protein n=1 Tax=Pseudomonas schmalbachii TaxID=2816993 RepID=A0ABS3TRN7_9PSED|nr:RHS repeat-associated core domain-containing protein [Pseudomonas schmalbachii]MBO3276337.1 RHS domain-containing protein [Pseudomonas schmalbachii]
MFQPANQAQFHLLIDGTASALQVLGFQGEEALDSCYRFDHHDGHRYRYDAIGNLIQLNRPDGTQLDLHYDAAQRLVLLQRSRNGQPLLEASYSYDALSRRIGKTIHHVDGSEQHHRYGWDGDRLPLKDDDQRKRTLVYLPGTFVPLLRLEQATNSDEAPELLAVKRLLLGQGLALPETLKSGEATLAIFHTDHLGTPLRLTDSNGHTLWSAEPDDWAAVCNEQGTTDQPLRFQGQYHDEKSGLCYNQHRYYFPEFGRYISQNPIKISGGTNTYAYVNSSLLENIDHLGLRPGWTPKIKPGKEINPKPQTFLKKNTILEDTRTLIDNILNSFQPDLTYCSRMVCGAPGAPHYEINFGPHDNWAIQCTNWGKNTDKMGDMIQEKCSLVESAGPYDLPDNCECYETQLRP